MAKGSKRASTNPTTSSTSPGPSTSKSKQTNAIDYSPSFTQVPSSLSNFVAPLSRDHVYLVHLDTHARAVKRQIFIFPLILNLAITAVILTRVYAGIYTYPPLILAVIGQNESAFIDPSTEGWSVLAKTIVKRAITFLIDYLLVALFLPWPVRFVTGPGRWRTKLGFQNVEVVVRKSREWGEGIGHPRTWANAGATSSSSSDENVVTKRILPAMTPVRLQTKTGFLMIDADWDLDFAAMMRAHELIDARSAQAGGKTRRENFEPFLSSVLVYGGDDSGWLVWRLERDGDASGRATGSDGAGGIDATELSESQRDKILTFKDKLTEMGKEDLFFRWVELVQYESSQPGGFTPERQRQAMDEVQKLFEKEGVDFEKFWAEVGGMEGLTG